MNRQNKSTGKMKKPSRATLALTALFIIGFLTLEGCDKKESRQPKVSGFSVSECLDQLRDGELGDTIYVSAIGDTKLKISTANTCLVCCEQNFWHEIEVQGQDITVTVLDDGSDCNCVCWRSLEVILDNLELGQTYTISLKRGDYDYFRFEVTFEPDTELMFVI